jgi:hypothetical protein
MKLTDTPIFENLCKLRRMIYDAHRYMTHADRQRFMDELLHLSGRCIECFAEAYDFPDSRREAIKRCMTTFAVLRTDLQTLRELHVIKYPKPQFPDGYQPTPGEAISRGWIELYEVVGRIDDDLSRYRAHLAQSRSASAQGAAERDH